MWYIYICVCIELYILCVFSLSKVFSEVSFALHEEIMSTTVLIRLMVLLVLYFPPTHFAVFFLPFLPRVWQFHITLINLYLFPVWKRRKSPIIHLRKIEVDFCVASNYCEAWRGALLPRKKKSESVRVRQRMASRLWNRHKDVGGTRWESNRTEEESERGV